MSRLHPRTHEEKRADHQRAIEGLRGFWERMRASALTTTADVADAACREWWERFGFGRRPPWLGE